MQLPKEFEDYTRHLFGEERYERFLASFGQTQPVSVRLNPWKNPLPPSEAQEPGATVTLPLGEGCQGQPIAWCRHAYRLDRRPDFTLDPLLHAGCYYVQEAGSMFLDEVLRQILASPSFALQSPLQALDLCAAPGGKSTLLRAALADGDTLHANEPDRKRANILMENIQKQGHPNVIVTNNYARDYRKARLTFDLIVADVPCSGEGMFRKDEGAVREWSIPNVLKCQALQRSIIEDIWPCLKDDGILIYSTCTFNTREDEENVRWICEELGAETIAIDTRPEWDITGSLLPGYHAPVYRFIPGVTPTEGLFMAVLRKTSSTALTDGSRHAGRRKGGGNDKGLRILSDGSPQPTVKGKNIIPAHEEALLVNLDKAKYPLADVDRTTALNYLRHEAVTLPPDVPKGFVIVCYEGHPLGFVKNLGTRANNLYPQEWKIRFK